MEHGYLVRRSVVGLRLIVSSLLCAAMLGGATAATLAEDASGVPAQIDALLDEARSLLRHHQPAKALDVIKKAEKLDKESCVECLLVRSQAYLQLGRHKDAVKAATRVIEGKAPTPTMVNAYNLLALGLQRDGRCKPEDCLRVEKAYREAIRLSEGDNAVLRFNLAVFFLRVDRREEGLALLREVLEEGVDAETSRAIQLLLAEPECAESQCAPEYALTTTDGGFHNRRDLKGKAVLLFFWGTGRGPRESIPTLNGLSKRAKDEPFALFAISFDVDEPSLVEFGQTHGIEFPLCYDRGGAVTGAFGVTQYPTAVIIDHQGHIIWKYLVLSQEAHAHMAATVGDAIKEARKAAERGGTKR